MSVTQTLKYYRAFFSPRYLGALIDSWIWCISRRPIRTYRHSDATVYYSKSLLSAKRAYMNVGSFCANFYQNPIFLNNLRKALESDAEITYFLGPAVFIKNREELFRILKSAEKRGNLHVYYRKEFDEWDKRHFALVYRCKNGQNSEDIIRVERRHDEFTSDKDKWFIILKRGKDEPDFSQYEQVFNSVISKYKDKYKETTITSILEECLENLNKDNFDAQRNRYKGAISMEVTIKYLLFGKKSIVIPSEQELRDLIKKL